MLLTTIWSTSRCQRRQTFSKPKRKRPSHGQKTNNVHTQRAYSAMHLLIGTSVSPVPSVLYPQPSPGPSPSPPCGLGFTFWQAQAWQSPARPGTSLPTTQWPVVCFVNAFSAKDGDIKKRTVATPINTVLSKKSAKSRQTKPTTFEHNCFVDQPSTRCHRSKKMAGKDLNKGVMSQNSLTFDSFSSFRLLDHLHHLMNIPDSIDSCPTHVPLLWCYLDYLVYDSWRLILSKPWTLPCI